MVPVQLLGMAYGLRWPAIPQPSEYTRKMEEVTVHHEERSSMLKRWARGVSSVPFYYPRRRRHKELLEMDTPLRGNATFQHVHSPWRHPAFVRIPTSSKFQFRCVSLWTSLAIPS
jgi:hypothetical protein